MRLRNIPTAREELARSPYVINENGMTALRGRWEEVFPESANKLCEENSVSKAEASGKKPLRIEIGMGKGQFLLQLAARHPEINFAGIERYSSVLVHPVRKLENMAKNGHVLTNLLLLRMDAERLSEIFAPGEVDGIYLNFSDPWPKDRHAKRRLPGRVFLERFSGILSPEGKVEFKTDNRGLFEFAIEEAHAAGWTIDACTFDLHNDPVLNEGNIMTEYEAKFSAQGNPICKLIEHP